MQLLLSIFHDVVYLVDSVCCIYSFMYSFFFIKIMHLIVWNDAKGSIQPTPSSLRLGCCFEVYTSFLLDVSSKDYNVLFLTGRGKRNY